MLGGLLGCAFGVLGILPIPFTGFIFVPVAAICSLLGLLSAICRLRFLGFLVSVLGCVLAVIGGILSPSVWLLVGLASFAVSGPTEHAAFAKATRSGKETILRSDPISSLDSVAASAAAAASPNIILRPSEIMEPLSPAGPDSTSSRLNDPQEEGASLTRAPDPVICAVDETSRAPLNYRAAPRGQILGSMESGEEVEILETNSDARGNLWVLIADGKSVTRGWAFKTFIRCSR